MAEKNKNTAEFFFILLLLGGGYNSLKFYVYKQINKKLPKKIKFGDLSLGIFPLAVNVKNVTQFPIKDKNILSFEKVSLQIPFFSLFSKIKTVNLYIHQPKIVFDESLLKKEKEKASLGEFKINKVNIIDGELVYATPKLHVTLLKFNLLTFPRSNLTIYRLTSPHLKVVFPFSGEQVTFEGQMLTEFRRQGKNWKIIKLNWQTPVAVFNLNGRVYRDGRAAFHAFSEGSARQILDPLVGKLSIHELMYGNFKIKRNKEGRISIDGNVQASAFTLGGKPFKNLKGTLNWENKNKRVRVNLSFRDNDLTVNARVESQNKVVKVSVGNISAAKLTQIIDIYDIVPLGGIIKKGDITIHRGTITGTVHLVQDPAHENPQEWDAGGHAQFTFQTKTKAAHVSAPEIQSEFGKLTDVKVIVTPKQATQLSIDFKSTITDSAFLDKYSTFYINLPLSRWKLQKGNGSSELHLKKINHRYYIKADLLLRDFYSCGESLQGLKAHIETEREITTGTFNVFDPDLQGEAKLRHDSQKGGYTLHFNNLRGEAGKVLNILEVGLDLHGRMKGNFLYSSGLKEEDPLLTGTFQADQATFYDHNFENLSGTLEYASTPDAVKLKNLEAKYLGGDGRAEVFIDYSKKYYNVNGKITAIDFQRMNSQFKGKGDLAFSGQGEFEQDPIAVSLQSGDIHFYADQSFRVNGSGKIRTNFSDHYYLESSGRIVTANGSSPVSLQLNQVGGRFDGKFHGDITDINLLIPWGDNQGQMNIDGRIVTQAGGEIGVEGHADFQGNFLSFPNFPQTLDNFSGDLLFNDLNFTLRSLRGSLGDGNVEGSGVLNIKNNQVDQLSLRLSGKNVTLHLIDRSSFTLDADLTLRLVGEKLLLAGDLDIHSGLWEREVDEGVSFFTGSSLSASGTSLLDLLEFDLKMVSKENVQVRNSLGEVKGKLNLRLTGNYDFPVLTGIIESRKGFINFSGKKFELIKGKLNFNNKFLTDPQVDIESEAFIKNYRIKFTIKGLSSKLSADLQSSPPLPSRDIFTLISVGELFRRPKSAEIVSQVGAGTTDLIASELTEQIKKRTKKFLGDYVLTIDPNISNIRGEYDSSRLIVGKEVLKDFLIVYSTNFSTQRQEVVYVQYQLSPTISLIGMRNEEERFSIELRFRKRKLR